MPLLLGIHDASTVSTMCVISNFLDFKKADRETLPRGFIKHRRSENSPSTMHNSLAEFQGFIV